VQLVLYVLGLLLRLLGVVHLLHDQIGQQRAAFAPTCANRYNELNAKF
jgi:hypothetical protein